MKNRQVLIVDDEEMIVDAVRMLLDEERITSSSANDRADARAKIEEQFYPVVVTDIRLHTVEEGLLLLDEIRTLAPESRVVCMSGWVTSELESEVRRRGARMVVNKAMADTTLVAAVMELLAEVEKLAAEQPEPIDLEQLYLATRSLMKSIPMRRFGLSAEQAEDVMHEAWMLFLEKRGMVHSARAWLAGTVANLCLQHHHRSRREILDDELLGAVVDQRSTNWSDSLAVRTALERIDSRSRLLCEMIGIEGRSYAEVSEMTGYAPGAIGPLYMRAKDRLKKALGH